MFQPGAEIRPGRLLVLALALAAGVSGCGGSAQAPKGRPPAKSVLRGHRDLVLSLAFSPDGRTLASGAGDHTVRLWDVGARRQLGSPLRGHTDIVLKVAFSADGHTVASASPEDALLWDVRSHRRIGRPVDSGIAASVALSQDGRRLATVGATGSPPLRRWSVQVWDVATRRPLVQPLTFRTPVVDLPSSIALSPDRHTLAVGSATASYGCWTCGRGNRSAGRSLDTRTWSRASPSALTDARSPPPETTTRSGCGTFGRAGKSAGPSAVTPIP